MSRNRYPRNNGTVEHLNSSKNYNYDALIARGMMPASIASAPRLSKSESAQAAGDPQAQARPRYSGEALGDRQAGSKSARAATSWGNHLSPLLEALRNGVSEQAIFGHLRKAGVTDDARLGTVRRLINEYRGQAALSSTDIVRRSAPPTSGLGHRVHRRAISPGTDMQSEDSGLFNRENSAQTTVPPGGGRGHPIPNHIRRQDVASDTPQLDVGDLSQNGADLAWSYTVHNRRFNAMNHLTPAERALAMRVSLNQDVMGLHPNRNHEHFLRRDNETPEEAAIRYRSFVRSQLDLAREENRKGNRLGATAAFAAAAHAVQDSYSPVHNRDGMPNRYRQSDGHSILDFLGKEGSDDLTDEIARRMTIDEAAMQRYVFGGADPTIFGKTSLQFMAQ